MQYHFAVARSTKEWVFSHSQDQPIYGTGQGSGNSPHIWTMISSVLLSLFTQGACGARYQGQAKNTVLVDDVNTHHTGRHTPDELGHNMVQAYN
jgi:hypothetical protein